MRFNCKCGRPECNESAKTALRFKIFNEGKNNTRQKLATKPKMKSKGSMTDIAKKLGIKIKEEFLTEDALVESKADQQKFIDKFGKENFDIFWNSKQRLKNKGINVDILWHVKNTSLSDMRKILNSISDEQRAKERDIEGNLLPEPTGNYDVVFENEDYIVYHPHDYISSIYCAKGGRWCTAGGYMIPEGQVKVSQAKTYFNQYTDRGVNLYYFIKSDGDRYALAVYSDGESYEVYNKRDENIGDVEEIPGIEDIEIEGLDLESMRGNGTFATCENCGERMNDEDIYWGPGDSVVYCEYCFFDLCAFCGKCGLVFYEEDIIKGPDGEYYCKECAADKFAKCSYCDEYIEIDSLYWTDNGDEICDDCLRLEGFHFCGWCGNVMTEEDYTEIDDDLYCPDCVDRVADTCSNCGVVHLKKNLEYVDGKEYCPDCYENNIDESFNEKNNCRCGRPNCNESVGRPLKFRLLENELLVEGTKYDKKAATKLAQSGLFSEKVSIDIVDALFREDIHAFVHSPAWLEKYLIGIVNMLIKYCDGDKSKAQRFLTDSIEHFEEYLTYIKELRPTLPQDKQLELDKTFNEKMSYEDMLQELATIRSRRDDESAEQLKNAKFDEDSDFELVEIDCYETMNDLFGGRATGDGSSDAYAGGGGTAWCHANSPGTYDSWIYGGKQFFVLAHKNWENIPFDEESNNKSPKDTYGNSLIAILVSSKSGRLLKATLRCNHVGVHSNADNQYTTYAELSRVAGFNVEQAVKSTLGVSGDVADDSDFDEDLQCANCGCVINDDTGSHRTPDGDIYCGTCFYLYYNICDGCGCIMDGAHSHWIRGHVYCENCFDERSTYCCNCLDDILLDDAIRAPSGDYYCRDCFSNTGWAKRENNMDESFNMKNGSSFRFRLTEDIAAVKKNYPKISDEDFERIIRLDPTFVDGRDSVGQYGKWLLNLFNKGKLNNEGHVKDCLSRFEQEKKNLKNKDIGQFKSLEDVDNYLNDEDNYKTKTHRQEVRDRQKDRKSADLTEQADIVYKNNFWTVWTPKTYAASCKLGQGSSWCTASTESDHYYKYYTSQGPLFIVINNANDKEKYQFHFETASFMDIDDNSINFVEFIREDEGLFDFFKEYLYGYISLSEDDIVDGEITISIYDKDDFKDVFGEDADFIYSIIGSDGDPYEYFDLYSEVSIDTIPSFKYFPENVLRELARLEVTNSDEFEEEFDACEDIYDAVIAASDMAELEGLAQDARDTIVRAIEYADGEIRDGEIYISITEEELLDNLDDYFYDCQTYEDIVKSMFKDKFDYREPYYGYSGFSEEVFYEELAYRLGEIE